VLRDAVGEDRADALDQTGAEIAPDALDRRREDGRVVLDGELLAVLRVRAPAALHPQRLPDLRAEERPDDREEVAGAPAGVYPRDGVAVVLVRVRDALQHAFEGRHLTGHDPTVPAGSDNGV